MTEMTTVNAAVTMDWAQYDEAVHGPIEGLLPIELEYTIEMANGSRGVVSMPSLHHDAMHGDAETAGAFRRVGERG